MQMLIKGIRSFAPENNAAIEFYKPLTLIVGSNGAGKTVRKQMRSIGSVSSIGSSSNQQQQQAAAASSSSSSKECAHGMPQAQQPMQQQRSRNQRETPLWTHLAVALATAAAATLPRFNSPRCTLTRCTLTRCTLLPCNLSFCRLSLSA
jgi:recombinational DNA repair ATPase RecF